MGYTKKNLVRDVDNESPRSGCRRSWRPALAARPSGAKMLGLSLMKLAPGFRVPFGQKHEGQEEVYVVLLGVRAPAVKVEDEIVELGELDAIRLDRMCAVEAGPDGVEYLAFGARDDPRDAELVQSWWKRVTATAGGWASPGLWPVAPAHLPGG